MFKGLRSSFQRGGRKPGELGLRRKVRVFREEGGSGDFAKLRVYAQRGWEAARQGACSLIAHSFDKSSAAQR